MNNKSNFHDSTNTSDEFNPWIEILVEPRETINQLVKANPGLFINMTLIYFNGVHFGINRAINKSLGDSHEIWFILSTVIIFSGFGGLLVYNLYIWAINISASWLGGKGDFNSTRIAFAWSMVPIIVSLFITLVAIILFGKELFTTDIPTIDGNSFLLMALFIYGLLVLALYVWHFIILVVSISEIQQITIIKSILSLIMGFLLLLIPATGFIYLITLIV